MNTSGDYRNNVSIEERQRISSCVIDKYPDKLPLIVEYEKSFPKDKRIPKFKFLVPKEFRMLEFTSILRNKLKLESKTGVFIFVGKNSLVRQGDLISQIYAQYSDPEDQFLYLTIALENVYG